jgi:YfiH family protein
MQTSKLLAAAGIRHGFSTRADGDARGAGVPEQLAATLGLEGVATCAQVHGVDLVWPSTPGRSATQADALATRGGLAVGVLTADCVPILLAVPGSSLGAAVHAGWRGTLAGVATVGVEGLCAAGARREELLAVLGPCIRPCCYEVGEELAERFVQGFEASVVRRANASVFLDLGAVLRRQLEAAGVQPDRIESLDLCTSCSQAPDGMPRFHSYRRQGPSAGRQLSLLRPG